MKVIRLVVMICATYSISSDANVEEQITISSFWIFFISKRLRNQLAVIACEC